MKRRPLAALVLGGLLCTACSSPDLSTENASPTEKASESASPTGPALLYSRCIAGPGQSSDTCEGDSGDSNPEIFSKTTDSDVRVTVNQETEFGGVVSPDGKSIALSVGSFDECRLGVVDLASHELTFVTPNEDSGCPEATDWSPDGTWILFEDWVEDGAANIGKVRTDGTRLQQLTDRGIEGQDSYSGLWMSRGQILYQFRNHIVTMDPDGGRKRRIAGVKDVEELIRSPDRHHLAWSVLDGTAKGRGEIYVSDPDGAGIKRVTQNKTDETGLSWSPDGRFLAFWQGSAFGGRDHQLKVLHLSTGRVRSLGHIPSRLSEDPWLTVWSPDSHSAAFAASLTGSGSAVFAVNVGSRELKRVTDFAPLTRPLAWIP